MVADALLPGSYPRSCAAHAIAERDHLLHARWVVTSLAEENDEQAMADSVVGGDVDWSRHPYATPDWEPGLSKKGGATEPVEVQLGLSPALNGVLDYDDRKSVASMKFLFATTWIDPRLKDWPANKPLPPNLWRPDVLIGCRGPTVGGVNTDKDSDYAVALVKDAPAGTVTVANNATIDVLCGSSADISQFPLDRHLVTFFLCMPRSSVEQNVWSRATNHLTTIFNDTYAGKPTQVAEQEEWRTSAIYWATGQHVSSSTGIAYSDFMVAIERRRMPQYMLHKAAYPITLSAAFGLYCLAVPSEQLAERLGVLLSLFLTVYAIQWVSGDRMPKTSKLTWLDRKVYLVVLYLFLMATVSFALKKAADVGVEQTLISKLEDASVILFGVALMFAVAVGWWQIRDHASVAIGEVPDNWHGSVFGMQYFKGCAFMATTDIDGRVGSAQAIPGMIDAPQSVAVNPTADGR